MSENMPASQDRDVQVSLALHPRFSITYVGIYSMDVKFNFFPFTLYVNILL